MLLDEITERESRQWRAYALLAGLPTSAVYNTLRQKPSDHVWQPRDFVKEPVHEMTAHEATVAMRVWMSEVKARN